MTLRRGVQGRHLIIEDTGCQVVVDGSFVAAAATGGATPVGDHDGETLIGEPLGGAEGIV